MIISLAQALAWSAITALPVILLALIIGRLRVPARLKVWASRVAFLKLLFGLLPLSLFVAKAAVPTNLASGPANPQFSFLLGFLIILWLAGIVVVSIDLIKGYVACRQMVAASRLLHLESITQLADRVGMPRPMIRQGQDEGLPFATGIFRPTIVVPVQPCEPSVIAHELAHIRSRDLLWNLIARITLGIFWFCPLIHKLEAEMALWQEAVADQDACRMADCPVTNHAKAIVRSVARPRTNLVWDARLSGNGQLVGRRLKALYTQNGSRTLGIVAGAVVLIGFMPWRMEAPKTDQSPRAKIMGGDSMRVAAPIASPVGY